MSHRAFRYDVVKMTGPRKDHRGYLVADAVLARTGIQEYQMPDGKTRRELRPDDEVMHPDSLDTIRGSVAVNNHPPVALDAWNTKQYAVGFLKGEPKKSNLSDGCKAIMDQVTIYDASTIADVEKGKNQISQGYFCDVEMTPGIHPVYGAYDAIQRNIKHNHSAIVDEGRAGPEVGIKMDSQNKDAEYGFMILKSDAPSEEEKKVMAKLEKEKLKKKAKKKIEDNDEDGDEDDLEEDEEDIEIDKNKMQKKDFADSALNVNSKNEGEKLMPLIFKLDGEEGPGYQFEEKHDAFLTKVGAKLNELKTLKADNAQLSKNLDEQKAEIEKLKVIVSDEKAMEQRVEERLQVKAVAKEMFPEETKLDSLSTLEIQKKIVKKMNPEMDVEKKDAAFVQGMALGIISSFKTDGTKELEGEFKKLASNKDAGGAKPVFNKDKAEAQLHLAYKTAWKTDLSKHDKGYKTPEA